MESGYLRESSAVRLSGMPLEQQDEVMAWLEENGRKGTTQDAEDAIKAVQPNTQRIYDKPAGLPR